MTEIRFEEIEPRFIKELIDKAGFQSISDKYGITLIDKKSSKADNYAELRFRSLREAVKAVQPYLIAIKYKVVA